MITCEHVLKAEYWMDVSNASYYTLNEKGNKGSQMGHTKNKIKCDDTSS
jgi:hypothetical protein